MGIGRKRVKVFWDGEGKCFEGWVKLPRCPRTGRYHVEYDDGTEAWEQMSELQLLPDAACGTCKNGPGKCRYRGSPGHMQRKPRAAARASASINKSIVPPPPETEVRQDVYMCHFPQIIDLRVSAVSVLCRTCMHKH